ncbi:MAG TPA: hypothetical protein VK709_13460 [Candidatus Saccharimonadales bacterium]|jgi:hypothetical protein|nr:hypothetical protein [Candidatus Saccharimonadales bacterium]
MKSLQTYLVESVQVEGEHNEFTRIELEGTGLDGDCTEITILTDADDTSDFKAGRTVRASFDFVT